MAEFKEWEVQLTVLTEHNYGVSARTEEEAIDIAQQLFDDGEEGEISMTSIEETFAVDGESLDPLEEFEDEILVEPNVYD